ncbi:histone-lysine N-methyltransferase SETMAR-like [Portunus trituberculatus]|uniref:histone-lysine N-methyltransferase SETMAR-like n=1 Tax=Portunus trituberculatus TaxID=210409 RepID=UPI001E1CD893|nr:histone-lysine N-methyltransferase SETMAR-like [Portunus trituberculatus]
MANRRVIIDEVACSLQISHGSAFQIIHDELGFHKVCARWVPRELTAEHKRKRLEVCQRLLDRYNNDGERFLSRIVTGDETWVHHYEPESKRQSMEWKHPGSPATKKFKTQASARKVMLTLFWDSKDLYWKTTWKRGARSTVQAQISPLPTTISLDCSKMVYEVGNFLRDEDVKEAVHKWLHDQPQTFFSEGIRKLVDRWTKCIEKQGDYIEK